MNEQFLIYLWSISGSISALIGFIGLLGIIGGGYVLLLMTSDIFDNEKLDKKWLLLWLIYPIFILIFVASFLIPSKQDLALIWAYPYIKKGITSEKVQAIPDKILDVANGYLDSEIKKLNTKGKN